MIRPYQLVLPGLPPASEPARPFVKWAGGKTQLLPELLRRVPQSFNRYYEPFLGGGALFFALQPAHAILGDINAELIQLYGIVRDDVDALITELREYRYEREFYYRIRAQQPEELPPVRRAARTLYLNRTCFNGLYRVNRNGKFNVSFGRYRSPTICDAPRLRAASRALQGHDIACRSYDDTVASAQRGDFVYLDPPYHPVSETANFTSYTSHGFSEDDQRKLADVFTRLVELGVHCLLTNSDCSLTRELYAEHQLELVQARRSISRHGAGRGKVGEVVVRGWW